MDRKLGFNTAAGLLLSAGILLSIFLIPGIELEREGKLCLAFTAFAVIMWIFKVMDNSYTAGLYLMLLVIFDVGELNDVFAAWTEGTVWLVIGSFIIAQTVVDSGICKRFSYIYILRFVRSYRGTIVSIFILSLILALLIPNPWPRAFILIGVVKEICEVSALERQDRANLGFAVFAASIPTCFLFQTGAASMNQLVLSFGNLSLSWTEWLKVMSVPSLAITALYCILIILLYPQNGRFELNLELLQQRKNMMGPMSKREIKTLVWLAIAIVLWLTDGYHGIHVSWSTMGIAMIMAMPTVGGLVDKESWKSVPLDTLIYVTAAVAIGRVGMSSGMMRWITDTVLPSGFPNNIWMMSLVISLLCMLLHVFLGSTIAANSVIIPSMLLATASSGLPPLCCIMLCYFAIFGQYVFSYQHINILIGIGDGGMYQEQDSLRLVLPLTLSLPIVILISALPWWRLIGILP